jgi:hypothetical protein
MSSPQVSPDGGNDAVVEMKLEVIVIRCPTSTAH